LKHRRATWKIKPPWEPPCRTATGP